MKIELSISVSLFNTNYNCLQLHNIHIINKSILASKI